ncbi:MAG: PIN domain-containing protein [Kiritimatiellia bacterium]
MNRRVSHSLDTSFVIRLLTRDPLPLYQRAAEFLGQWKKGSPGLLVPDLVLAETYFALQHHYIFSKEDALSTLHAFARHPAISVSPCADKTLALPQLSTAKPGFVDRLIHGTAETAGIPLVTFEKSAKLLPNTLVLGV